MAVKVAEYFGQRTDVDETIEPVVEGDCPFACNHKCKKLISRNHPVCAVRRSDGTLWIVCPERLCSTKKDVPLCLHQRDILFKIAQTLFGTSVQPEDILVKREERLPVNDGTSYNADYIMVDNEPHPRTPGPLNLILEMQGGGETTNTGEITRHLNTWASSPTHKNSVLSAEVNASTLETNAWRRQQEQFLVKGNIATKSKRGTGMAFVVGTLLFDYLKKKLEDANLPNLKNANWTLAIIAVKENDKLPIIPGPIPLTVDESRTLFTNYSTFVTALTNQGLPCPNAFSGDFVDLLGNQIHLD